MPMGRTVVSDRLSDRAVRPQIRHLPTENLLEVLSPRPLLEFQREVQRGFPAVGGVHILSVAA